MKKILYLVSIMFLLYISVINVSANSNEITLMNVEIVEKTEKATSNIKSLDNLNINLNTILFKKNDYVKYKITLKNTGDKVLKIEEITDNFNSDLISNNYDFENKILNKDEDYSFFLTMKCNKDIEEEKVVIDSPINILIKYDDGSTSNVKIIPKAFDNIFSYIILSIGTLLILIIITKNYKKIFVGLIIVICIIPVTTKAMGNKKELIINNNIKIYGKIAKLDNGISGNETIKKLIGYNIDEDTKTYNVVDTTIKKIIRANSLPDNINNYKKLSSIDSNIPIYIWIDGDTIYYYTESEKLLLSDNSRFLFANLQGLEEFDTKELDTSYVTDMYAMFYNCINLTNLDTSELDTSNVTNMAHLFRNCSNLEELDLSNFDTSSVTNMSFMFRNCENLEELNISKFDTSNVNDMSYMFMDCSNLNELDVSNFDTSNVTNMMYMFTNCQSLTELDVTNLDTSKVVNFDSTFRDCRGLTSIDLSNFSIENSVITRGMFYDCINLVELDLTNFYTENEIDMSWMFRGCNNLERVIFDTTRTIKLNDINHMFCICPKIDNIDLTGFDTSRVKDMRYVFYKCSNLKNVNLSKYDTSSATTMQSMFYMDENLENVDVSLFDTSNVTNIKSMFFQCESLTELDLSNFDTSSVEDSSYMFSKAKKLEKIYVSDKFVTNNITESTSMFNENPNLVGGNGTSYSTSHKDKEYARIDCLELPGYFTEKMEL